VSPAGRNGDRTIPGWSLDLPNLREPLAHNGAAGWFLPAEGSLLAARCRLAPDGPWLRLAAGLPSEDVAQVYPGHPGAGSCRFAGLLPAAPFLSGDPFEILFEFETSRGERIAIGPLAAAPASEVACLEAEGSVDLPDGLSLVVAGDGPLRAAPRLDGVTLEWEADDSGRRPAWRARIPFEPGDGLGPSMPRTVDVEGPSGRHALPLPSRALLSLQPPPEHLGFPRCRVLVGGETDALPLEEPPAGPEGAATPGAGTGLVTVCTIDHLHFARVLVASVREHHPDLPVLVVVADAPDPPTCAVEGATVVSARRLAIDRFSFLALKYSPSELCCALKPFAVREAARGSG
jgi:hypothetical protein